MTDNLLYTVLIGATGFMASSIWEYYSEKRKTIELSLWTIRATETEKRLREFYWPIYLRLQRDNVVWEKLLERWRSNEEKKKLAYQLEADVILPNHLEIIKIIESGMHFVRGDKDLEEALLKYLRHVDVYRSVRAMGIKDKDPIGFGEPYPLEFFKLIEKNVHRLQAEYDKILSEKTKPPETEGNRKIRYF